jgi:hypothetical protein
MIARILDCALWFTLGGSTTAASILLWMLRKIADAPQPVTYNPRNEKQPLSVAPASPNPGIGLTKAVMGPSQQQLTKEQAQIQAEVDLRHNAEFRAQMRKDFNWDPDDDTYGIENDGSVVQYEQ